MKFILGEALQKKYFTEDVDEQGEVVEQPAEEVVEEDCVAKTSEAVMDAYQSANKWLDIVKEAVYTDLGCVFFSSYIHNLAHTMPARFDKFGDILHTVNRKIPYPATSYIPNEPKNVNEVFDSIFMCLDNIKNTLNKFIKCTDDQFHGMACAAEELLNDIEGEYPMLFRLKQEWEQCGGDNIKFDKYVNQYVKNKGDLLEAWSKEEIVDLMNENDNVLYGALVALYNAQTDDEKNSATTKHQNGAGFNGPDAEILTSIAKQLIAKRSLSEKQKTLVRNKLKKYAKQLTSLAAPDNRKKAEVDKEEIPQA